ncbi:MAG: M23 family metallopeptidase [Bacteroidales bacterium]|nr:M23 family metallopeptidase [Bacteroidales bacterium]
MANSWGDKLKDKYRLVISDSESFEERISFRFTPISLAVTLILSMLVLVVLTSIIIAFTPLREYIPGYGSAKERNQIWMLTQKVDSLETIYRQNAAIEKSIRAIVLGEYEQMSADDDTISQNVIKDTMMLFTKMDSILLNIKVHNGNRNVAKNEDIHKIKPQATARSYMLSPIVGRIQQIEPAVNGGINIQCGNLCKVCAVNAGTIVYADISGSNSICVVHHPDDIVSVYRMPSRLSVAAGQAVKAKQVLSVSDEEQVVHFELWVKGNMVDPERYIMF